MSSLLQLLRRDNWLAILYAYGGVFLIVLSVLGIRDSLVSTISLSLGNALLVAFFVTAGLARYQQSIQRTVADSIAMASVGIENVRASSLSDLSEDLRRALVNTDELRIAIPASTSAELLLAIIQLFPVVHPRTSIRLLIPTMAKLGASVGDWPTRDMSRPVVLSLLADLEANSRRPLFVRETDLPTGYSFLVGDQWTILLVELSSSGNVEILFVQLRALSQTGISYLRLFDSAWELAVAPTRE